MEISNIILIAVVFMFLLYFIGVVNMLIGRRNNVRYASSSVDTLLKKRYDLIPNLVAAVQHYMTYEKSLLQQVTELRARAVSGNLSDEEKGAVDAKLGELVKQIVLSAENYPDLKASKNFLQLQAALNEVEEQISAARRAFSASITEYNNAVQMLPTAVIAFIIGFKTMKWFEIPEKERTPVDVGSLLNKG